MVMIKQKRLMCQKYTI